jgi:hypothetical protein
VLVELVALVAIVRMMRNLNMAQTEALVEPVALAVIPDPLSLQAEPSRPQAQTARASEAAEVAMAV